jgi:RHS repeat-associated protein
MQVIREDGTVVNRYDYDAFGNAVAANTSEQVENRYRFQGREYDAHRGDYYFRNRTYIPEWGVFTGPDALVQIEANGPCNYLFANNNPLRFVDPEGLDYIWSGEKGKEYRIAGRVASYRGQGWLWIPGTPLTPVVPQRNGEFLPGDKPGRRYPDRRGRHDPAPGQFLVTKYVPSEVGFCDELDLLELLRSNYERECENFEREQFKRQIEGFVAVGFVSLEFGVGIGLILTPEPGTTGAGTLIALNAMDHMTALSGRSAYERWGDSLGLSESEIQRAALIKDLAVLGVAVSTMVPQAHRPLNLGKAAPARGVVNPRLLRRLKAWRAYRARGGAMTMKQWVSHTQGASWGTGFKSGYGNWIRGAESVHGNSLMSTRTAYLYKLEGQGGEFLKWGVSQNPYTRYPKEFMMDKTIRILRQGSRSEIMALERNLVGTNPGPLNAEPWAGSGW